MSNPIGTGWGAVPPDTAEAQIRQFLEAGTPEGQALVDAVNAIHPQRACKLYFSDAGAYVYALNAGQGTGNDFVSLDNIGDGSPVQLNSPNGAWNLHNYGAGVNDAGSGGATLGTGFSFAYPKGLIVPQLGLLEDDILYRLALLCVNVLQPLKNKYPGIVIVSGFRRANSGTGQHEQGEAVDLQIRNQTPELIYEVADWIAKNLNFDHLILNWTNIGDNQPWIHVSFAPNSLRGLVQTKDFADNFHDGLFVVEALSGEAAASAKRDNATATEAILKELQTIQSRQERTAPKTATEATNAADITPPSGTLPFDPPNMLTSVQQLFAGGGSWDLNNDNVGTMSRGAFVEAVVAMLRTLDANWGHSRKGPGQLQYAGHSVDTILYKRDDLGAAVGIVVLGVGPQWVPVLGDINKWY